jgi:hypothetical protein
MAAFLLNVYCIYLISHTLTSGVKGWGNSPRLSEWDNITERGPLRLRSLSCVLNFRLV